MKINLANCLIRYSLLGIMAIVAVGCNDDSLTSVSGTITDEVGVPIVAALVTADDGDDMDVTDVDGNFTVEVPANCPDITVTADGFDPLQTQTHRRYRGEAHFQLGDGTRPPCERMDVNGDGIVSADEWAGPEDIFITIDSNDDGNLSEEELIAGREQHRERRSEHGMPGRMDADGNGGISSDEWLGDDDRFASIDTDGNGELSKDEMDTHRENQRP